jgi:formate dehydrogenase iron-sulfur subunit
MTAVARCAQARGDRAAPTRVGFFTDTTLCIGCKACEVACKQWNQNPWDLAKFNGTYQSHDNLSAQTWTLIKFTEEVTPAGDINWMFQKHNCMHCADAACVMACPTDALFHSDNGVVNLDFDKCIGCGYCEEACPFDAIHVDAQFFNTQKKAGKCTLCYDRITNGHSPACVQACPTDCIKYGSRADLVKWGKERVALLKTRGFENAYLYGENELGGLHQLYVLTDKPEKYGLPADPRIPKRVLLWQKTIKPFGKLLLGGMLFGLIMNFFVNRAVGLKADSEGGGH